MSRKIHTLCYLVVIFVLVAGICPKDTGVDSFFACKAVQNRTSEYLSENDMTVQGGTVMVLSSRSVSDTQQMARPVTNHRRDLRMIWVFVCMVSLSQLLFISNATFGIEQFQKHAYQRSVLRYIQNKDGKK